LSARSPLIIPSVCFFPLPSSRILLLFSILCPPPKWNMPLPGFFFFSPLPYIISSTVKISFSEGDLPLWGRASAFLHNFCRYPFPLSFPTLFPQPPSSPLPIRRAWLRVFGTSFSRPPILSSAPRENSSFFSTLRVKPSFPFLRQVLAPLIFMYRGPHRD